MRSNKEVSKVGWGRVVGGGQNVRTGGRDAGSFSAESWWSCSHTGPSSPPSAPASPSAGDKTRPLPRTNLPDTTFGCLIFNTFFFLLKQAKDDKMKSILFPLFVVEGNLCKVLAGIECIFGQIGNLRNCPTLSHLLMTEKRHIFTLVSRLKAVFFRSCNARCMNSNAWQSTHGRPGREKKNHKSGTINNFCPNSVP